MAKIIYDFGSNNGDDLPYYLKKADLVVAVEANPILCEHISMRFIAEIAQKKLVVENFVLTDRHVLGDVFFYRHKKNHVLSQFPKPDDITEFEETLLPAKSVLELIAKHGDPYYIKIDVEHYDEAILRVLFENNVRPPFISAESHSIKVFSLLVTLGGYNAFKLVNGASVPRTYRKHQITTENGIETYSFPPHSAGPFGEDVLGEWMTANNFFQRLGLEGMGWKDIHATNICEPTTNETIRMSAYIKVALTNYFLNILRKFTPKLARKLALNFLKRIADIRLNMYLRP